MYKSNHEQFSLIFWSTESLLCEYSVLLAYRHPPSETGGQALRAPDGRGGRVVTICDLSMCRLSPSPTQHVMTSLSLSITARNKEEYLLVRHEQNKISFYSSMHEEKDKSSGSVVRTYKLGKWFPHLVFRTLCRQSKHSYPFGWSTS